MTEKRFFTHENMVSDTEMIIPVTIWSNKEQQQKFCDELNNMENTINNLSKHLEKALPDNVDLSNSKNISIADLYMENKELKRVINDILLKTECREDYSVPMYSVTVAVNPQIYKTLSEMIKKGRL